MGKLGTEFIVNLCHHYLECNFGVKSPTLFPIAALQEIEKVGTLLLSS